MHFPGKNGNGLPFPTPGDLSDSEIKPVTSVSPKSSAKHCT